MEEYHGFLLSSDLGPSASLNMYLLYTERRRTKREGGGHYCCVSSRGRGVGLKQDDSKSEWPSSSTVSSQVNEKSMNQMTGKSSPPKKFALINLM
jgi:hypothetical protein